jgi:hypothetical protein
MGLRNEQVSSTQIVVDIKRWAELQSMEWRHLGYLRAAEYMGLLQQRHAKLYRDANSSLEGVDAHGNEPADTPFRDLHP